MRENALAGNLCTRLLPLRQASQGVLDNLNKLIAGTELENLSLEEDHEGDRGAQRSHRPNNAAQTWNPRSLAQHSRGWRTVNWTKIDAPSAV
jgi:hypothetical protein